MKSVCQRGQKKKGEMGKMKIAKPKTVEKMLAEAQGKARVRTIDSLEQLESRLQEVLDRLVCTGAWHEKDLVGLEVRYVEGAEYFPNAYKGVPEGTYVRAVWNGKRWDVEEVDRANCDRWFAYRWTFGDLNGKF